jgi:hypothetical protein
LEIQMTFSPIFASCPHSQPCCDRPNLFGVD